MKHEYDNELCIEALRRCAYRPDAEMLYDLFAGGLIWTDEAPDRDTDRDLHLACVLYTRPAIAYRASLTKGKPREDCKPAWERLKHDVPDWPGFAEERIHSEELRRRLRRENAQLRLMSWQCAKDEG